MKGRKKYFEFCPAWEQSHSFASFGLCVGLCGLQMCMAAKGWLICFIDMSMVCIFQTSGALEKPIDFGVIESRFARHNPIWHFEKVIENGTRSCYDRHISRMVGQEL